jgi:hypothetical protein
MPVRIVVKLVLDPSVTPASAGHIVLVGSATPPSLQHPQGALAGLMVAICKWNITPETL